MTKAKPLVYKVLHSVFKDFPELLLIAARRQCNVYKVDCDNTLVESAIILMLSVLSKSFCIGSKERAASHTRIYVAFEFLHLLFRDVIGNHSLCSAFSCKNSEIPIL